MIERHFSDHSVSMSFVGSCSATCRIHTLQLASESSGEICTMISEYIKQCTGSFEKLIYYLLSTVLFFADSPLLNAVCSFWDKISLRIVKTHHGLL